MDDCFVCDCTYCDAANCPWDPCLHCCGPVSCHGSYPFLAEDE